jgi:pimeloyl-ACP methyl ester carboxylesterase
MSILETPSGSLSFSDSGEHDTSKAALVLVHGWCCSGRTWDRLVAELGGAYRTITLDLRGCGGSSVPSDHAFGAEALTNDIVRVCAHLGVRRPILIGHSYGAFMVAKLVQRMPAFAGGAILIDQSFDLVPFCKGIREIESVVRDPSKHFAFREDLLAALVLPGEALDEAELRAFRTTPIDVGLALWSIIFEFTNEELAAEGERLVRAVDRVPSLFIERAAVPAYEAWRKSLAPSSASAAVEGGHWLHQTRTREVAELVRAHVERCAKG